MRKFDPEEVEELQSSAWRPTRAPAQRPGAERKRTVPPLRAMVQERCFVPQVFGIHSTGVQTRRSTDQHAESPSCSFKLRRLGLQNSMSAPCSELYLGIQSARCQQVKQAVQVRVGSRLRGQELWVACQNREWLQRALELYRAQLQNKYVRDRSVLPRCQACSKVLHAGPPLESTNRQN